MNNQNDIEAEFKLCFQRIKDALKHDLSDPKFLDSTLRYIKTQIEQGEHLLNQRQVIKVKTELEVKMLSHSELIDLASRLMVERNNLCRKIFRNSKKLVDTSSALTAPSMRKSVDALRNLGGNMIAYEIAERLAELSRRRAEPAIEAKLAKDPKQVDKALVKECWEDWRAGKTIYKGKAAFARDMLTKCEHLESTQVIEGWCLKWERESEPS